MKKQINILLVLMLFIILSSCITSQEDVNKAKQNLGIIQGNVYSGSNLDNEINKAKEEIKQDSIEEIEKSILEDTNEKEKKEEVKEEVKKIEIKPLTDNQFLELDDLSGVNLLGGEVEITGKTLANVDKIVVKFKNDTSDFPDDNYTLKQFKPGGKNFLYRAFSRYETLDFGKNIYIFEAYSGDKVSKLELVLNVIKDEEKNKNNDSIDIDISKLPSNEMFGTPTDLGDGSITYSDLNGLIIKSEVITDFSCDNVTSVLADKVNGYFYWNTCRPIKDKEGVSFFVIKLDGDKYIYEKDYYLPYQGLYGTQELETGTGVTSENIGEKNSELKEKNSEYGILKVSDELFKEILK